ncbi:MAG: hypothetical protein KF854_11730 [Nitrospira sp.]|nr:hypothetical protein [Nitrospira sp.]MBX3342567.1 hypothetical protein [Nitrospira sp.]HMV57459.1 hypothetical protein [Nitrospira sp.]HMW88344.1 hypothetical protein [Nitrospira sp.]HNA47404.1 hypothetical protein [Nitrospira sp.]
MTQQQHIMVERVDELERMIVRLNGRIGELQRELQLTKGLTQGWSGSSRLRTLLSGMKSHTTTTQPVRENRRVQRHDVCLF